MKLISIILITMMCTSLPSVTSGTFRNGHNRNVSLNGIWKPVSSSSNYHKLVISKKNDKYVLLVWVHSTLDIVSFQPLDLTVFSKSVDSQIICSAIATKKSEFAVHTFILRLNTDTLTVETYTAFSDGSKRHNTVFTDVFKRKQQEPTN